MTDKELIEKIKKYCEEGINTLDDPVHDDWFLGWNTGAVTQFAAIIRMIEENK